MLTKTDGENFAKGFIGHLCVVVVGGFVLLSAFNWARLQFRFWLDDSDGSSELSHVSVTTDYKTGVQYLRSPEGGITPRLDKSGNLLISNQR